MHFSWIFPSRCHMSRVLLLFVLVHIFVAIAFAQGNSTPKIDISTPTSAVERPSGYEVTSILPVRTDSPRATFRTFLRLTKEFEDALLAYGENQTRANAAQIYLLSDQFEQLLDLSWVPKASYRIIGLEEFTYLLDIIGRIDLPPIESIPDVKSSINDETVKRWSIPGTPISIVQKKEGPKEGEFLFGVRTLTIAKTFYRQVQHLPLRTSLDIKSWNQTIPQLHGPMIPVGLVSALPDVLKHTWLGLAVWKILMVIIVSALAILFLFIWHRIINLKIPRGKLAVLFHHILTPAMILFVVSTLVPFFDHQVNISGTFARVVDLTSPIVMYLSIVWIFWYLILMIVEWIVLSPRIPDDSLDANLLRLSARIIGFVGGVLILAYGAQNIGLPGFGLLAGLGVGGLGVALAIRPTLENLISGLILYMDRPVRIGDYCTVGNHTGIVENIGVRSTQLRALDRTLISIPNSTFADMEIINWAQCDMMLMHTMVGLRYETEPDQLRYVLAKIREMFHAHPKIDRDTIRVRLVGYGASSLDIDIRVYVLVREWNEFYAIREDVLLRVTEIINESGTGFAFPSQTVYMGHDSGLDKDRSDAAMEKVKSWRNSGQLPFPKFSKSKMNKLAGTLDFPPFGSSDAITFDTQESEVPEPLSSAPLSTEKQGEDIGNKEKQTKETSDMKG